MFTDGLGRQLTDHWLRHNVLEKSAEAAELPWVGFHTFRHTCASLLFAGGKNVKQVQEWLGHSDPGFTLRTYVHLIDDGLGDAEFLDAATGGNTGGNSADRSTPEGTPTQAAGTA